LYLLFYVVHDEAFGKGASKGSGKGVPIIIQGKGKGKGNKSRTKPTPLALTDIQQEAEAFSKLQSMSKLLGDRGNVTIVGCVVPLCLNLRCPISIVVYIFVWQAWCCSRP
jgi:hypothetical protein